MNDYSNLTQADFDQLRRDNSELYAAIDGVMDALAQLQKEQRLAEFRKNPATADITLRISGTNYHVTQHYAEQGENISQQVERKLQFRALMC